MEKKTFLKLFLTYKKHGLLIFNRLSLFILMFFASLISAAQSNANDTINNHELTIYVIKSVGPIDWESPSALYHSYKDAYISHIFRKRMSLTGHLFVKLSSPLLEEPLYAGMCQTSRRERRRYVLNEKIGLGVLMVSMKAKLENSDDIIPKIDYFTRKNELASITYYINETAAKRLIEFYRNFTSRSENGITASDYYGGAFWPRFENEGSGCSAFGISMLDLVGIKEKETENWKKTVNIPMELIGGEVNNNQKIKSRKIKRTKQWDEGKGIENVDFIHFSIYDPSLIYQWINEQRNMPENLRAPGYLPSEDSTIPGLTADRRQVEINPEEPIFLQRTTENLFINQYYKKLEIERANLTEQ
jgi:hypothetical protein